MADEKRYISRIKLADGTTVNVKDQEARSELESLFNELQASGDQVTVNKQDILSLFEQLQWGEFGSNAN